MRKRTGRSRRECPDLLPPNAAGTVETWSTRLIVDPSAQLGELAGLAERGLMSPHEFERQRRKVADG